MDFTYRSNLRLSSVFIAPKKDNRPQTTKCLLIQSGLTQNGAGPVKIVVHGERLSSCQNIIFWSRIEINYGFHNQQIYSGGYCAVNVCISTLLTHIFAKILLYKMPKCPDMQRSQKRIFAYRWHPSRSNVHIGKKRINIFH